MRVKTEDRRQAIMQAALGVFHEVGYERASMSEIAARLGGSKATLYSYFSSKEELYAAAMLEETLVQAQEILRKLDFSTENPVEKLEHFARISLLFISDSKFLDTKRNILSQGANSSLGRLLYERGPKSAWDQVATHLEGLMRSGVLRRADPQIAALHLQGLLEAGIMEPLLHGAEPRLSIDRAAKLAVEAFMMIYGADKSARDGDSIQK
jgi:AcrR family transcriptional regulator